MDFWLRFFTCKVASTCKENRTPFHCALYRMYFIWNTVFVISILINIFKYFQVSDLFLEWWGWQVWGTKTLSQPFLSESHIFYITKLSISLLCLSLYVADIDSEQKKWSNWPTAYALHCQWVRHDKLDVAPLTLTQINEKYVWPSLTCTTTTMMSTISINAHVRNRMFSHSASPWNSK